MKLKFAVNDFIKGGYEHQTISVHHAVSSANERFEAWLSEQTIVYGYVKTGEPNWWGPVENGQFNDTHTAKLIDIQPINKPKCEHQVQFSDMPSTAVKCCKCDRRLKLTLTEA